GLFVPLLPAPSPPFPYTTLFRSGCASRRRRDTAFNRTQAQRQHPQDHAGQRRAMDLGIGEPRSGGEVRFVIQAVTGSRSDAPAADRKSTRLNSSHVNSSNAVFCL